MRRMHWIAGVIAVLTISGAYGTGCFFGSADDCALGLQCGSPTGSGTSATSSSGGGGSVVSDECVPSINTGVVPNDCGVFVALNGDDANPGTKEKPKKTMGAAITAAKSSGGKLYACGQTFQETVELPAGVALFGALDCMGGWSYKATQRTVIQGSADTVPLTMVKGAGEIRMEDVDVRAADATKAGGSSIALIVDGATVTLSRCELVAGNGMAGEKGATPMDSVGPTDLNDPSIRGKNGVNACTNGLSGNPGGETTANPLCAASIGGKGGTGSVEAGNAEAGAQGEPVGDLNEGLGGAGSAVTGCKIGGNGQDGATGGAGLGATGVGVVSIAGFAGAVGEPGLDGAPAQGGGGGGGAKGKVTCGGPGGGGGGAGGCGGKGGLGGTAGGSSIAIVGLNATLSFSDINLKVAAGGKGGDGGDGQVGGIGGIGGVGGTGIMIPPGCPGGYGGFGGTGGQGGGGRGGHSLGIAFMGKAAPTSGVSITLGMAGAGGLGADMSGDGAAGEAKNTLEFPAATP